MGESFYELFEKYMDDEEIEKKKKIDIEEEMDKSQSNNYLKDVSEDDVITMEAFVNKFLNVKTSAKKLLHCGLKDLGCPYVVGISNEETSKNMELVKRGYILIVSDYHNNRGSYLNPFYLKEILDRQINKKAYNEFMKQRVNQLELLDEYFRKYTELRQQVESDEAFFKIVQEHHKCKKLGQIRKYERMGEIKND